MGLEELIGKAPYLSGARANGAAVKQEILKDIFTVIAGCLWIVALLDLF